MESSSGVKVLEKTTVTPPAGSVPPTSTILLTDFDRLCYELNPVQRLFLYSLPSCSESTFLKTQIPSLKHSLSLSLQRFFPLAGKLLQADPTPSKLSYTEGDGVDFIVAVTCDDHDFDDLVGHHPRQATTFAGLVPKLTEGVLAIQVTLFPHSGIGVGVTYHHGAIDGSSNMQFLKTWAAFSRRNIIAADVEVDVELPCFNRNVVSELPGLSKDVMNENMDVFKEKLKNDPRFRLSLFSLGVDSDSVRATFVLTRFQIENLRRKILLLSSPSATYLSAFTLATAIMWRCMVSLINSYDPDEINEFESCNFFSNFRSQPTSKFPSNYFGNCIIPGGAKMRRDELLGEDGLVKAVVRITQAIQIMKTEPIFEDITNVSMMFTLAGSPKLGVYKVDFGWGRPRKVEVISIGKATCMSLAENRDDDEGGFEIGVLLNADRFQHLRNLFLAIVS